MNTSSLYSLKKYLFGILSPILFNVLLLRLLSPFPNILVTTTTCYANSIYNNFLNLSTCLQLVASSSLQKFVGYFLSAAHEHFRVSPPDSVYTTHLPEGSCAYYCSYICTTRIHSIVRDLLNRLHRLLLPLKWLTNIAAGLID